MASGRQTSFLVLLLVAAAAGDWADLGILERRENAALDLVIVNRAASDVTLANCAESFTVAAGSNATVSLAGLTGYWVVPDGVQWDCNKGPFNLFSVAANLTGPDLVAGAGYGLPISPNATAGPEGEEVPGPALAVSVALSVAEAVVGWPHIFGTTEKCCECGSGTTGWSASGQCSFCSGQVRKAKSVSSDCTLDSKHFRGNSACANYCRLKTVGFLEVGAGGPAASNATLAEGEAEADRAPARFTDKVAGVQLGAGADSNAVVRCRAEECDPGFNLTSVPTQVSLTIMGPQASPLSFYWPGGGYGGGYGGPRGYGWGGRPGWGGGGYGRPGWGGGGYRGGGWR